MVYLQPTCLFMNKQACVRSVPRPKLQEHMPATDQVPRPHIGKDMPQLLLTSSMHLLDVVEDLLQVRPVGHSLQDRCHAQLRVGRKKYATQRAGSRTSTTRITP